MIAGATSLLELAADLEQRDIAVATKIDLVAMLSDSARGIATRAEAIGQLLGTVPAEQAAVDRSGADALDLWNVADAHLAAVEALWAKVEVAERPSQASHDLERAREAASVALARVGRTNSRRTTLEEAERVARAEVVALVAQALTVAGQIGELPRVSESGRALPESTVRGLAEWAARVHAALLVVRGQLEGERERLVREANELGSVVLGEQLYGQRVELVARRVRQALDG